MWKSISNTTLMENGIKVHTAKTLNIICWYLTVIVSGVLILMYLYKITTSFALVKAEWLNEVRCHFFNAPNLAFLILLMSIPEGVSVSDRSEYNKCMSSLSPCLLFSSNICRYLAKRTCWGISFGFQILLTIRIYKAWMFSAQRSFSSKTRYNY